MIHRFDDFTLNATGLELRRGGEIVDLEPQVFALLLLLVENAERVVSKDELVERIWEGRAVSDTAITSRLKSARRALGDDGRTQRYIRTIHGKGMRFVGDSHPFVTMPRTVDDASREQEQGCVLVDSTKPSIAVLPFLALGSSIRLPTLPQALAHDLISALARLRWLFVIARGSSFRFRSSETDVREVGRALGVRYCLCGFVEQKGTRIEVVVELADTRDAGVVWSERYACEAADIHDVRERIVASIVASLDLRIPNHEAATLRLRDPDGLDAWGAYHTGLQHMFRFNRRDNAAATAMFERAVVIDPRFARAHAGLSFTAFQDAFLNYGGAAATPNPIVRLHAERSLDLDAMDPFANFTMGRSRWLDGDLDGSLPWLDRAVELSPSYAQGIYSRSWADTVSGRGPEGQRGADLAMMLSPLDPLYFAMLGTRALSHVVRGEDENAAVWAERAARAPGAHVMIAMIAVVAHSLHGDRQACERWTRDARERRPSLLANDFFRSFPFTDGPVRTRIADTLASAGF